MGLAEPDRSEVVAWGLAESGTALLIVLGVWLNRLKAVKLFPVRTTSDRILFPLLAIWSGACAISTLLGIVRGNRWDYLLGDLYRFGSVPFIFAAIYFAVKDAAGIHTLVRGFVAVYGIMVALDLVRFNAFLDAEQERLTTEAAHQAGMIAVAIIYLMLFDPKPWVRKGNIGVLLLTNILLFRAQMLTPLLTSLIAMTLFFLLSRKFAVFVGTGMVAAVFVVASFYSLSLAPAVPSYIAGKFETAQDSAGAMESLEALSGVRLGEIISIGEEFIDHPGNLFFGTGEGSLVSPDPILDPGLATDRYTLDKHYVHAELFDALHHNGAIATGAFLLFLWQVFRRGVRLHSAGNPFGQFVIVMLIVTALLLSYDLPFESAIPTLGLCFAGIGVEERASQRIPNLVPAREPGLPLANPGIPTPGD